MSTMMLTEKQILMRQTVLSVGSSVLFVAGLTMAVVGGLSTSPILFGIGLGICITLTVVGICVRERNLVS